MLRPKNERSQCMLKKVFILIVAICMVLSANDVRAYEVTDCNYWYSDSDQVGVWTHAPTVGRKKLNLNSNFRFYEGFLNAYNQWTDAGISIVNNGQSAASDIVCYGGTRAQINAQTGKWISEQYAGLTFMYYTSLTNLIYNGSIKRLKSMSSAVVYVIDSNNSLARNKNVFTHEMGHALGWFGHTTPSSNVMYHQISSIYILTNKDKKQLNQFYS